MKGYIFTAKFAMTNTVPLIERAHHIDKRRFNKSMDSQYEVEQVCQGFFVICKKMNQFFARFHTHSLTCFFVISALCNCGRAPWTSGNMQRG